MTEINDKDCKCTDCSCTPDKNCGCLVQKGCSCTHDQCSCMPDNNCGCMSDNIPFCPVHQSYGSCLCPAAKRHQRTDDGKLGDAIIGDPLTPFEVNSKKKSSFPVIKDPFLPGGNL